MPDTTDNAPPLDGIDHIHVFVTDRAAAEVWYARVLGLSRVPSLEGWAADGGPLTLADARDGSTWRCSSAARRPAARPSRWAYPHAGFMAWREHLAAALGKAARTEDHQLSWSMYFADPDGNPYEITSYEYDVVGTLLAAQGA